MTGAIENYAPASGRAMREDSSIVNMAEASVPSSVKDVLTGTAATTEAALAATPCSMIRIYNLDASIVIYWGKTSKALVPIAPGLDSGWIPIANANLVVVKSASGTPSYVVACL